MWCTSCISDINLFYASAQVEGGCHAKGASWSKTISTGFKLCKNGDEWGPLQTIVSRVPLPRQPCTSMYLIVIWWLNHGLLHEKAGLAISQCKCSEDINKGCSSFNIRSIHRDLASVQTVLIVQTYVISALGLIRIKKYSVISTAKLTLLIIFCRVFKRDSV